MNTAAGWDFTLANYDAVWAFLVQIGLLLLFMMGLPYAIIHIKKDYALNRLLLSRGYSCTSQLICEYISHFAAMLLLALLSFGTFALIGGTSNTLASILCNAGIWHLFASLLPILLMISAFNIMAYELANNIVSGMLIHFFSCLCMCYVAGCIYPIYTFPKAIQTFSAFLPTGMSVTWMSDNFTGKFSYTALLGILGYALVFLLIALCVRTRKTANKQKG